VAKDEPSWLPVTCAGCTRRWYGIERAHCTACHRTFTTVEFFDQHRVGHVCHNPASLGLTKHEKTEIWEPRTATAVRRRAG
jgi:hypothetical protein